MLFVSSFVKILLVQDMEAFILGSLKAITSFFNGDILLPDRYLTPILPLPAYEVPAIRVNTTKSTYTFTSVDRQMLNRCSDLYQVKQNKTNLLSCFTICVFRWDLN